jgi:predicted nucleic acid-binding protein
MVAEKRIFIPTESLLLDTNIFCKAFLDEGSDSSGIVSFLQEYMAEEGFTALVLTDVVVEIWGLVVGSRKAKQRGCDILTWVNDPSNATLIPIDPDLFDRSRLLCNKVGIDYIDALLIESSFHISKVCGMNKPLPIATLERRDYFEYMRYNSGSNLSIYDPLNLEYATWVF